MVATATPALFAAIVRRAIRTPKTASESRSVPLRLFSGGNPDPGGGAGKLLARLAVVPISSEPRSTGTTCPVIVWPWPSTR